MLVLGAADTATAETAFERAARPAPGWPVLLVYREATH